MRKRLSSGLSDFENQTYLLHVSSTLHCFAMAIEVVCTSLYSIFFQKVASFLLQRFRFRDIGGVEKCHCGVGVQIGVYVTDVARDAT